MIAQININSLKRGWVVKPIDLDIDKLKFIEDSGEWIKIKNKNTEFAQRQLIDISHKAKVIQTEDGTFSVIYSMTFKKVKDLVYEQNN